MMSWLRQHRYAFRIALTRLAIRPLSSLANIFVIALALAVPFMSWALLISTQPLVHHIPVASEMTLFLQSGVDKQARQQLEVQLQSDFPWIETYRFVSRDEALANLENNPSWAQALSVLDENPLPDAYVLKVAADESEQTINQAIQQLEALPQIAEVLLDIEWLQQLDTLLGFGQQALLLLSLGVMLIVIGTVFNTIRLQSLSHQEEIAVARLVGATESFVRRPFLYFGALTGLLASLLALLMGRFALGFFSQTFTRVADSYHISLDLHLPDPISTALAILLVIIVAALAARWSVSRRPVYQL